MEEKRSEDSVRQSQHVCAGEQEYVQKRKQVVLKSLNSLGLNCSEDSVPHIALLGTGGGLRAAVTLLGSLHQMEKDGLLDSVLYLGGVSGSTWSMSSLYRDPEWSKNMDRAMSKEVFNMTGQVVELKEVFLWLGERMKEEHFSLTDIWAAIISSTIMKQMDLRLLSDEASRNATNPYPIYCAREEDSEEPEDWRWFEVSPHEAGFTELGLFIETSLLGSKFENGTLQEKKAEMDMVKLQGICGSAMADRDTIIEPIKEHIIKWLSGDPEAEENESLHQELHEHISRTKDTTKDPNALSDLNKLHQLLEDEYKTLRKESESKSLQHNESDDQQGSEQPLVETRSESLEDGGLMTDVSLPVKLMMKFTDLIVSWEWGTTSNFLYRYQNSSIPAYLHKEDNFRLVDAFRLSNVPYPSFLGDKRDIDLFIAPEHSGGKAFESLTVARDYAAKFKKPFPEIDEKILEEKDWPKDCYVFEGKKKEPTIVYLPLFNRNNCKDAEEVTAKMSEFSTTHIQYSQDQIESLMETAKENMKRNKETLLREIKKAAERRRSRKSFRHRLSESCLFGLV